MSVSLPGYGQSTGPEDFAGSFTQRAVDAVLTRLVSEGLVESNQLLIQGISLGAVTAALVAADNPRVTGLVLISGLYDLPAYFAIPESKTAARVRASALRQTGGGEDALRSRSALFAASRIKASVLIINGEDDDRTDADQALRFAAAINASGGRAKAVVYAGVGHEVPVDMRQREIDDFVKETLGRSPSRYN